MKVSILSVCINSALKYKGNSAAVIELQKPLEEAKMQHIAKKLNQPATTFLWALADEKETYHVRWFAPDAEIGLCGHGSLAAFAFLKNKPITLRYKNGKITGKADEQYAEMSLTGIPITKELPIPETLQAGLGIEILNYYQTENKNIVLAKNESAIANMQPDFAKLRELETFGYTVTAQGDTVDFVSRTLVPHVKQLEDHATGSSHAALTPFWSQRLGKTKMVAHQLSPNGGKFWCNIEGEKVSLKAEYVLEQVVEV